MLMSELDNDIAKGTSVDFSDGLKIEFQFPPKITSDSKSSKWKLKWQNSYEPYAVWLGAEARRITLAADYVVHGEWGADKVQKQITNAKGHLYKHGGKTGPNAPYATLNMYGIAPDGSTWRVSDVNIKYSQELIRDGIIWPLHSKLTIRLDLFTQGAPLQGGDPLNKVEGLPEKPEELWY